MRKVPRRSPEKVPAHGFFGESRNVPPQLEVLQTAIASSREILQLPRGWDGEDASPLSVITFQRAVQFLWRNAYAVLSAVGIAIAAPRILPAADGSLDLHWKTADRELLVNIPADASKPASYYGDDRNGGNAVEGQLDLDGPNDWLFIWLAGK